MCETECLYPVWRAKLFTILFVPFDEVRHAMVGNLAIHVFEVVA